ncbi:MAG: hypothetical protein U9N41_06565 [Euryarchaeota archaeon]|nr:hypothetical protein [Euryarchaeota archaeon]
MKYLLENINDFLKNPRDWLTTIKFYITSIFVSQKEKNNVLIQAKNQSEAILTKNGLNIPFKVDLDDTEDIYFRTVAMYDMGSSETGMVKIFIKSHLIGKDIDRVVFCILHEYSHAIYEEGFTRNFELGLEILKLREYVNPNLQQKREGIVFDLNEHEYEKEHFCDWFAFYLMDKIKTRDCESEEKIKKICENIIRKYVQKQTCKPFFTMSKGNPP